MQALAFVARSGHLIPMTDDNHRPGPWDRPVEPRNGTDKVIPLRPRKREPETEKRTPNPRDAQVRFDEGQHPLWTIASTLLLGGFIWYIWGSWYVAVALVFGVFVHEYGHVLMMNRVGMGPAKIYIVPFFGGLAKPQREAKSEWDGVLVSLAGPVFGLLAAIPFFVLAFATANPNWLVAASAIAFLNLINLLPAPPLDGSKALGPVLAFVHPMLERVALIVVGALAILWGIAGGSIFLVLFLGIALIGYLKRGRWRPYGRKLTGKEAAMSLGLFLLSAALCVGVGLVAQSFMFQVPSVTDAVRSGADMLGLHT